ncbi:MAG: selenocysteine-specific translation elongation factor [Gammaproteobacteria bacterium]
MIVATAGHVDHGKTLLVKALTGTDTDRLPEEKARGLTIDLGFAYHDLGDGAVTGFVDVPGHEKFVRTMVAGVSGIDVVLFIIAADDGPMPQTAEHLAILDLLGVARGVVALTKIDRVDGARVAEVEAACHALLAPTALAGSPVVPVSAVTGVGIDTLRERLLACARSLPPRAVTGNFRLAVDRSFLLKGAGRVVTGTVFSGAIDSEAVVVHVPAGGELRVRGIHAQNRAALRAEAGQRCALNLAGSSLRDLEPKRGDWIVAAPVASASRRLDAEIRVLSSEARALANRTPVHVHIGAADVTGRVVTFDGRAVEVGASAAVQLLLDRELHAVRGDRVVLRDQSARRTLGGGVVRDPLPEIRGRSRQDRLGMLAAMGVEPVEAAFAAALTAQPGGVDVVRFAQAWNLVPEAAAALPAAVGAMVVEHGGQRLAFERARWDALVGLLPPALAACHAAQPDRPGATVGELAAALSERVAPRLLELVVEAAVAAGTVERVGGLFRRPGHAVKRSAADEALWKRVQRQLDRDDMKTPVVHDMLETLRVDLKILQAFLARSAQQGYVVRISDKRYLLPETVTRLEAMVLDFAHTRPDGVFSVADFRDASGIGRNAVVEILEYFDKVGLTRRHGQVRKVLRRT